MATIGFITTSYPRHSKDPSGRFVYEMARALCARGHQLEIVLPESADGDYQWMAGEGIDLYPAPYVRPKRLAQLFWGSGVLDNLRLNPWVGTLIGPAALALYTRALLRRGRWDGLISHWLLPSGLLGSLLSGAFGVTRGRCTHLAIAHSGDVHLLMKIPLAAPLAKLITRGADHLGFVSEDLRHKFEDLVSVRDRDLVRRKSCLAPMGTTVPPPFTDPQRQSVRSRLAVDGFVVLVVARLIPIKGVDLVLEALRGFEGALLVVAGDGPERSRLEMAAASRGVAARFLGTVTPQERDEWMSAADLVVVPSRELAGGRTEGLPLVVVEAMASGKPLVAAGVGGIPEVVKHNENGLLVTPGNAGHLRQALVTLREDSQLAARLGEAARVSVAPRDWRRLAPRYEDLLRI